MTSRTSAPRLAVRMKEREHAYRRTLPTRTYVLLRLDGKNFRAYTKGLAKPFDEQFGADMMTAAAALCAEAPGTAFGYVASDEISLLLTDFATPTTQQWLGGVEAKILSLSASLVTATFNAARAVSRPGGSLALFDSRLVVIDTLDEVRDYFVWRQRDTIKNSISMAASAHLSHRRLMSLNSDERKALLAAEAGVDWNDYPTWARQGSVIHRVAEAGTATWTDRRTGTIHTEDVVRHRWHVEDAPDFAASEWLDARIPARPDQRAAADRAVHGIGTS